LTGAAVSGYLRRRVRAGDYFEPERRMRLDEINRFGVYVEPSQYGARSLVLTMYWVGSLTVRLLRHVCSPLVCVASLHHLIRPISDQRSSS